MRRGRPRRVSAAGRSIAPEEAERIRRAVGSIEWICCDRPVGWYRRWMPSEHTRDMRFVNGTLGGPHDFFDHCRRALDCLWDEGTECPRMMSIGLHPRWTGQPARASALAEFIEYAQAKGDVWFARRREIAEWWLERRPPG